MARRVKVGESLELDILHTLSPPAELGKLSKEEDCLPSTTWAEIM